MVDTFEKFEKFLIDEATKTKKTIVLPEGNEPRTLKAAHEVNKLDNIALILLGKAEEIKSLEKELDLDLSGIEIIDNENSPYLEEFTHTYYELRKAKGVTLEDAQEKVKDVSYFGTLLVYLGYADGMVSGAVHTTLHTIKPSFETIKTKPGISVVSSAVFLTLPSGILVYADCAVNPNPTSEQLAEIAISTAQTAKILGIDPKIAFLSYSTGASGKGPSIDLVKDAVEILKSKNTDLVFDGPIQYDAAVDPDVAKLKLPDSPVAGHANTFIFPDLNSGNIAYKAVQRSTGQAAIGPVLQGLNKPVNDLSRGALVDDIYLTILITALQSQAESQN